MQLSTGKLAAFSISLLITVAIITTGAGLYVLQNHHRTLQQRHEAEARDIVRNAAVALRDLVGFYQGKPHLTAGHLEHGNAVDTGDALGSRLGSLTAGDLLGGMLRSGDRFLIVDGLGQETLSLGTVASTSQLGTYRAPIPDTPWQLVLHRPLPQADSSLARLVVLDTLVLLAIVAMGVALVRVILGRFRADLTRIHAALDDVLAGRYQVARDSTKTDEADVLFPQIKQLARKIEHQHDKIQHQSLSDPLTGLFNRRYFDLMLAHMHEQSQRHLPATLAVINLNDFQRINEEFGRPRGDRVLQNVARYLLSRVRVTDIVVRLGGDGFGLLLTNMAGDTLDDWLAALVHDYDHQTLENGENNKMFCRFSVGVALIDAQIYPLPTAVFNAADNAMYTVKQRRKTGHSRYAIARPGNVQVLRPLQEAQ